MSENTFELVTDHPVTAYRCGARAGDQVRLKHDIVVKGSRGRPRRQIHPKGQIWTVLCGAVDEPVVVWLQQADGEIHTWNDGSVFLKTFEVILGTSA